MTIHNCYRRTTGTRGGFRIGRDAGFVEVRGDFSDHFWVFDGDREVLLLY